MKAYFSKWSNSYCDTFLLLVFVSVWRRPSKVQWVSDIWILGREAITFELNLTIFKPSFVFRVSWGRSRNWLEHRIGKFSFPKSLKQLVHFVLSLNDISNQSCEIFRIQKIKFRIGNGLADLPVCSNLLCCHKILWSSISCSLRHAIYCSKRNMMKTLHSVFSNHLANYLRGLS